MPSEVVAAAQAPVCQRKCCRSEQARQMLQPSSAHGHDSFQRASSHATVCYDGGLVPPLCGMVQMVEYKKQIIIEIDAAPRRFTRWN